MSETELEGLALAQAIAKAADEMQAEDVVILDLKGISTIADYFVICSGTSHPHLKAIRREVAASLDSEYQLKKHASEGTPESHWLVLDYRDVIVHIFHNDKRDLYSLEDLWSDAITIPVEADSSSEA
ncbi:MAG: ribosome silencing factor [Verrucomicrobiales bacterium]|nr:ribosome silencing factor [Verrucomicrobiales bacterium]